MKSLRMRLFVMIAATTVLVWSAAAAWIYVSTRAEVQRVLDRRLIEAAGMVASLATSSGDLLARKPNQSRLIPLPHITRQLSCQIWTLDGQLIGRSSGAPDQPLAGNRSGFSEREIAGETWRVYTVADPARAIRVSVGDNLRVRHRLINDLMLGLLAPAIAGLVALAVLIWAAVGIGLAPLREVARLLAGRDPSNFEPLEVKRPTDEVRPLVAAIDDQFTKLQKLRADERHFIASAAHELQTPLAGLRAHADVASMAKDATTREKSLRSIRKSVDRTARMVGQLLDLSREENSGPPPAEWTSLDWVLESVADELSGDLRRKRAAIVADKSINGARLYVAPASLMLALRNLLKNAIDHSPAGGGIIEVHIEPRADRIALCIRDQGLGVEEKDMGLIKARFVRGARVSGPGSGLGLSIVELVARHANADLSFRNLEVGGFEVALSFKRSSVRLTDGEKG